MTTTELRYGELTGVTLVALAGGTMDLVVNGMTDGDVVFLKVTCPFIYEIHSWYGLRHDRGAVEVAMEPGCSEATSAVACYGALYGKGLLADAIRLDVYTEHGLGGGVYVSSQTFSKWPEDVRPTSVRGARDPGCPRCGHQGIFVRTALCCPQHGPFAGF